MQRIQHDFRIQNSIQNFFHSRTKTWYREYQKHRIPKNKSIKIGIRLLETDKLEKH